MAINLGSAYGKVSLDVRGLLDAVRAGKQSLQSLAVVGEQVGQGLKNVGQKLTLGLTLPILAAGAASIKLASSYEETKNKATVVFGEMADSVVENSERAADALGMSNLQYLDYASSLGAALTAGGMGVKEATELAEGAVKHFADLASFHEARVEDVAVAWQSAIRGQYEPIQRYFPFINDAYLKTYGAANGLVEANTKQLTANQRAIILNAIALNEQLNPALDDFAETSDSFANSAKKMKANLDKALITLGQNLLPIALEVVQAFNKMLQAFNNLTPFQQKMVLGFLAFLAVLGPLLSLLGSVISIISGLAGLAPVLSGLGISVGSIGAAAGAAGAGLAGLAASAAAVILPILLIVGAIALLYWAFKTNFMGITTTAQQLWFIVKYYFREGWEYIKTVTNEGLVELGGALVNGFASLRERFTQFADWVREVWSRIREFLANAFRQVNWSEIGRYILWGIANGMLAGIPMIVAAATRAAQAALTALRTSLDSRSPSRKAMIEGLNASRGFTAGMDAGMDASTLTRIAARPLQAMAAAGNQQSVTMHFAGGISFREANALMDEKIEKMLGMLTGRLAEA